MVSIQLDPEYGWVLLAAVATYSIEKWMVSIQPQKAFFQKLSNVENCRLFIDEGEGKLNSGNQSWRSEINSISQKFLDDAIILTA